MFVGGYLGNRLGAAYDYDSRYYGAAGLPTSSLYSYPGYTHTAYVPELYRAMQAPPPEEVAAAYNRAAQSCRREFTQNIVIPMARCRKATALPVCSRMGRGALFSRQKDMYQASGKEKI